MQSIHKSVLIGHSAQTMFDLIDGVENYPQFLPWCGGVIVHEHTDTITDATIQIRYFGLKTQFRTRNQNRRPTHIDMHFVEGPFRSLTGTWNITPLNAQACKIEFYLDYEFSSTTLERLIGPVFDKITTTFVDAFVKQADCIPS
jgi:ribosome-associated toxin RatA of RatAB toxin-antitoxin module